jgi:hypothetical protein
VIALLVIASALLGGLGRRVAGGSFEQWTGINLGDYPVRAFFGATLAAGCFLGSHQLWSLTLILSGFLGCAIPNFGGIGMGRSGNPWQQDAGGLNSHGTYSMGITALPLAYFNWHGLIFIIAAGYAIVPFYELGWRITGKAGRPGLPLGLRGGSELGELFWGAACGIGAFAAAYVT